MPRNRTRCGKGTEDRIVRYGYGNDTRTVASTRGRKQATRNQPREEARWTRPRENNPPTACIQG